MDMFQIACPTCKELYPWSSISLDQRCYKCKYAATDIQRMQAQAPAPDVSLEPPEPEPTLDEKIAAHLAPEPGGSVEVKAPAQPVTFAELQDKINSLELRIEQLNDAYDSQEAFIDMQAEQLRKAKYMIARIARIARAADLYLS